MFFLGYFENGDFNHAKSPFDAAGEETDTSNVSKRDSVYDYEDEDDEDDDIPGIFLFDVLITVLQFIISL